MLDIIRNEQPGKTFAILGSAPSLPEYFKRTEDQVIGVNGASSFLKQGDIFLSADERAHERTWYKAVGNGIRKFMRPQSAFYLPEFAGDLRSMLVSEYEGYMDRCPEDTVHLEDGSRFLWLDNPFLLELADKIPQSGHIVLKSIAEGEEPISRDMARLNVGGTGSCIAVQMAYIMGASEIHLYGVEFSNDQGRGEYGGGNYFYDPLPDERGRTLESQRVYMDKVIRIIDIPVFSHGPTNLEETIRSD